MSLWMTPDEVLKAQRGVVDIHANSHREDRERWYVALFCKLQGWQGVRLKSPDTQADSVDIVVMDQSGFVEKFQIAEATPKEFRDMKETVGGPHTVAFQELAGRIIRAKEGKNYSDVEHLNLLVCFNNGVLPAGKVERAEVVAVLRGVYGGSVFKSVGLLWETDGGQVLDFVKGLDGGFEDLVRVAR